MRKTQTFAVSNRARQSSKFLVVDPEEVITIQLHDKGSTVRLDESSASPELHHQTSFGKPINIKLIQISDQGEEELSPTTQQV